jgi:hypothetical protein
MKINSSFGMTLNLRIRIRRGGLMGDEDFMGRQDQEDQ